VAREAAPAAADVEDAVALLQAELRADQLELGLLRLLERGRAAREDRAAVGHRRVEEQGEELGRQVVVVADRAAIAGDAVAPAVRDELRRRARGRLRHAGGLHRRDREARLGRAIERRRLPLAHDLDRRIEVVDLELARDVGAPDPELERVVEHVRRRPRRTRCEARSLRGRGQLGPVPEANAERTLGERLGQRGA
jgi:hypothetical protein